MKLLLGIFTAGLLSVSVWQYGPERAYGTAMDTLTPDPETMHDVREAISALINSFDGPGEIAPSD
ncbi:MAG: hypothetical protein JJU18_12365 [Oceanicaulis sp.]|nr:hypothetical protein [Oceanicaulis sp.]